MADDHWKKVKELLQEAFELEPEKRAAFLAEAYATDPSLRAEVESLMALHQQADSFLEKPPLVDSVTVTRQKEHDSGSAETRQIGPYRILQEIGHGGTGVVYEAEQETPVHRKVALKLIKWGMDTKQVIARFESERQALALMNHPNIAGVYDAGATEHGRPYFAMELVHGEPITQYCDKNRLTIKERLNLFIQVCEGVQHAHQKGVIHRDIKPSNILITIQDDKPVPKIIDFGVAKATSQKLTERTVYTELGQLIGTPEYMSPEQAEMTGIDIDTRTDVYSLGVVLYELLVGAQPFDAKTLRQSNFDDMRRTIREEEPPKPSTRLSRLGEPSTTAAKNRRVELRSLERELRGDLDWITMRTLEKDRTRRYGSASDLAADIRRHLNHEPVVASPPSTTYRATKFVRRHSMGVASATVIALLLIALVVGMAVQAGRIALERDRAEKEAAKAQSINAFLQGMLGSADPRFGVGRDVTVVEALDAAMEKIDESFRNEPEIEAAVRQTIGITYANLGRNEQGAELLRSALEIRKETLGSRHPDTVSAMLGLAFMEYDCGHAEEAEILIREAVSISEDFTGQERSLRADALNTLATILTLEGDYRTPKQLYRESYEIFRDVLGSENHLTLVALGNLAGISHKSSDYDEAESMLREVLGAQRKILGEEHTDVALTMTHLANVLHDRGDYKDAEELHRDAVRIATKTDGDSHPAMAFKLASLAKTVIALGDCKEGLDIFERAVEIDKSNPREDIELLIARRRSQFSASLTEFQCYGDAEVQLLDALEMQMRRVGKLDEQTQSTFRLIVELYEVWGKPEKASEYRAMLAKPEETEQ